jgi:TRAP-type uncharacterized transport system fused permease subunit
LGQSHRGAVAVVAILVIFSAVLNAGEAGQGVMNVAAAAAGRLTGGATKVSVLSSALFGSISGSASANVASAAGMIGENWLKVALTAMTLGLGLYIIPLAMIANPALIQVATDTTGALIAFGLIGFGLSCLS